MTKPTGRPRGRPPKVRNDGAYQNVFLSVGNSRDRSAYTTVGSGRTFSSQELDTLYENDGFARRIIDLPAEEMVREGFEIENIGDDDQIEAILEALQIETKLADALRWANLYGGALIVMLANDGGELTDPLNVERVKEVEALRVYDRWEVSHVSKYTDPADKRFGQVQTWMISPANGYPYQVHESRCVIIDGSPVPARVRERNDGWGASKLQHAYDQLTRLNMSHHWANSLLERAQQAVHGIPDLTNILRAPGGEAMVRQRIDLVDMARGINNTVVIDAQESYDLKSTGLSGVDATVDRFGMALCAVTGMPETLLFGRAPGGLSNSAKNDLENWYAKIAQQQKTILKPAVDKIVGVVLHSIGQYTEDYKIEFEPLWVPSEKEEAETANMQARTDEIYVNMGALDGSEMRKIMNKRGYEIDEIVLMPEIDMPESEIESARMEGQQEAAPIVADEVDAVDPVKEAEAELIRARADSERAEADRKAEIHKLQIDLIDEVLGGDNA